MTARRSASLAALAALLVAVTLTPAQSPKAKPKDAAKAPAALAAAQGTVGKVDKETLTVKPRGADGRFGKDLVLQITGTSRATQVTVQTRAGKTVAVQQDADLKSLQAQQSIAVIYTTTDAGSVLLSAVVQPVTAK